MWLWLSLITLLCWSGSDLFSKIGCRDGSDKYSHLKMVIAVGVVMGLHAAYEIFIGSTEISWSVIWTYLPISLLYISSMALGYLAPARIPPSSTATAPRWCSGSCSPPCSPPEPGRPGPGNLPAAPF